MKNKELKIDTQNLRRRIGLASMYSAINKQHDHTLSGEDDTKFREPTRINLNDLWDVPSKSDWSRFFALKNYKPMIETLNWLKYSGHRKGEKGSAVWRAALAWDVARYVDNIRAGFYLNYINLKTALEHLECAYEMTKDEFVSWEDYVKNYLFYKNIWDNDKLKGILYRLGDNPEEKYTPDQLQVFLDKHYKSQGICVKSEMQETIDNLFKDRNSIWNQIAW